MSAIYDDMLAAGVSVENHYSDLYVPVNEITQPIVAKYSGKVYTFVSQIDGKQWYDIPFAYLPYWEARK